MTILLADHAAAGLGLMEMGQRRHENGNWTM
jgi:hypothetical protein